MSAEEVNFDGLVGPTHNFGGLSEGNVKSIENRGRVSNPRAAALQGLEKMRLLMALGIPQAVLPPHERPDTGVLRQMGFSGSDAAVLEAAWKADPALVTNVSSASAMWAANAATVSPSVDAADGLLHVTPANLASKFHRSLESAFTAHVFRTIFLDSARFAVHEPLPKGGHFGDEGAANHMRLAPSHGEAGVEIFVFGRSAFEDGFRPRGFAPRQAFEASEAVARLHKLDPKRTLFIRQAQKAIDAGAFHNDVVAVSNGPVMLAHEFAFETGSAAFDAIERACSFETSVIAVREAEVPLEEAIRCYLFNCQLATRPGGSGSMVLILPEEVKSSPKALAFAERLVSGHAPIDQLIFADIRQSMWNGGGPACLRLRVVLTQAERDALKGRVLLDEGLVGRLENWVRRHYRDRLTGADLVDPALIEEGRAALDELTGILDLGPIYAFQRR
ncbi:succinylarginine dihydrolase [Methylocella tundrae]|uniref:N-succinylarginine dihydrolase n=1 Tax=Methylocella tundrae TaxID=227605 RepID=A0A8B6M3V2_METTU|nr:N-succinylarginine dihydrolase [Methylocella tundrae]VTZ48960.1 succinylarginine dihydrolase [Methylocella tundrae]